MIKKTLAVALCIGALTSQAFACSNILVAEGAYVSVGRTMDWSDAQGGLGDSMGFSATGSLNVSNINFFQSSKILPLSWKNKYSYIGQTNFQTYSINDGINSVGVYAGFLYLPGITKYPEYNASDKRAELGVAEATNYILGMSASVEEAVENLKKIQLVANTPGAINLGNGKTAYLSFPVHLVVRDKYGSSLLVEWVNGKTKTYYHKSGSNDTIETTNFSAPITHTGFNMSTVTNTPQYSWQINNVKQYDTTFNGNTNIKVDGLHMNGSGFTGIPGDYTPPSRFVRLYQIAKFTPKANNQDEAEASVSQILLSVITPLGASPDSTHWLSVANLKDSIYYWKPIINISSKDGVIQVAPYTINSAKVIKFDLNQLQNIGGMPRGFVSSTVSSSSMLTKEQTDKALEFLKNSYTQGNIKVNKTYQQNLAVFDYNRYDLNNSKSGVALQ